MVSAETPLKERAPLIRDFWYREEQKYGQCVSLEAVLEGKLTAARKR